MPESNWDRTLAAATEEVLETMFFTSVYGPADSSLPDVEPHHTARLTFEGMPCGALTLRVSEPAARTLAANFLAAEDGDPLPPLQVQAVVCELANMVCGALLSRAKSETPFRLSSPELAPDGALNPPYPPDQFLDLGDGTLALWLTLENHAV